MSRKNPALIVIDVQHGLFTRKTPIYKEDNLLGNINVLIDKAHSANKPVYYIQHCSERLVENSEEWKLHPILRIEDNDTGIIKRYPNAFQQTGLKSELEKQKIKELIITGVWTHNCVQGTCKGALELGYEVILVQDGHSSDGSEKIAKKSIDSWNEKLEKVGVTLKETYQIEFS